MELPVEGVANLFKYFNELFFFEKEGRLYQLNFESKEMEVRGGRTRIGYIDVSRKAFLGVVILCERLARV